MKRLAILSLIIFSQFAVFSQAIDSFSLLNAADNTSFSLSTYKADKAIVLIFYSGKCAYGEHYFERIVSIKNEYSPRGVKFVLINANSSDFVAEESIEEMKKFADTNNLNIPYLADKEKKVKNRFEIFGFLLVY